MRAPLFLLTTTAVALAAVSAACFDWDGLLGRCQDAGNCLPPGGSDSGDGGDGGDGGGGAGDAGQDGGSDAGGGDGGAFPRGAPCAGPQQCATGACPNGFCTCLFNGPCQDSRDCCLGQVCMLPGTCVSDVILTCGGATAPCTGPGGCCSTCNVGSGMCDCSPNGITCNMNNDCCSASAACSLGKHCCEPLVNADCSLDDDCCSRVCRGNKCR